MPRTNTLIAWMPTCCFDLTPNLRYVPWFCLASVKCRLSLPDMSLCLKAYCFCALISRDTLECSASPVELNFNIANEEQEANPPSCDWPHRNILDSILNAPKVKPFDSNMPPRLVI
jgi:hypothetical protein